MEVTNASPAWNPEDVDRWAAFLRSPTGQLLIPKLVDAAPRLLTGGNINEILIRNGEVLGFSAAVQVLLELTAVTQAPSRGVENYPPLDSDELWPAPTTHSPIMPEDTKPIVEAPPNPATSNAEVLAKLGDQGRETTNPDPAGLKESGDALDALAKAVVEPVIDPGVAQNGEVVPAVVPDPAAVKAEEERAAHLKRSEEFFKESPTLPPGASPKSSEAFSAIKIKAAQEISAREQQLEETRKKLADAEAKLNAGPDPATQKELEEHRQWRAKLDVDADPRFKEFDKTVSSSQEFIYAQLRKSPAITSDIIDQIKKLGGPENVNLEKIFAAVKDPTLQRLVEAKVADIEMAKFNKEEAVKATKANISDYLEKQRKSYEENVGAHNTNTRNHFYQLTTKLPWFAEKPVDPKADESTRKAAEDHNVFLRETKAQLEAGLKDDSPEMRAMLLTGMAQLLYMHRIRGAEQATHEATKKELADAKAQLEKLTKASVGRLRETGAPPGGNLPKPKGVTDFSTHAGDALDSIAKQVMQERATKLA